MTLLWPDDPDIRRAVAAWGQLLDETLLADGGGAAPGLAWPDDGAIAHTLAEWGVLADRVLDEATARAAFGPIGAPAPPAEMAWLEGSAGWGRSPSVDADPPVELVGLVSVGGGTARKHKTVLPGEAATITGWTVRVAPQAVPARPPRHQAPAAHRWGLWATVAAAVAAVALVGGTRPADSSRGQGQAVSVALGASGPGSSASQSPGHGGANGSSGSGATAGPAGGGPTLGAPGVGTSGAGGGSGGSPSASGGRSGPAVAASEALPRSSGAGAGRPSEATGSTPVGAAGTVHPAARTAPGATAAACPTTTPTTTPPPPPAPGQLADGAPLTSSTTIDLPTSGTVPPGVPVVGASNPPSGGTPSTGVGVSAGPTGTGTSTSGTRSPGSSSGAASPTSCPSN